MAATLPEGFVYYPDFISKAEADALFSELREQVAWRQEHIRILGKQVAQPRLSAWYGRPEARYSYSGLLLQPLPWLAPLAALRDKLSAHTKTDFNSVLCNLYRDGNDSMGWHADDEPELGLRPVIASVSLGGVRRFKIKPKGGGPAVDLEPAHGSLLIMQGDSQRLYLHSLPKTARPVAPRINLTFRNILSGR